VYEKIVEKRNFPRDIHLILTQICHWRESW